MDYYWVASALQDSTEYPAAFIFLQKTFNLIIQIFEHLQQVIKPSGVLTVHYAVLYLFTDIL
jgi:hypothetical protein